MRRASPFPLPRCAGCGAREACAMRGQPEARYPACHAPIRGVDLGRARELFRWLAREAGGVGPRAEALEAAVLARFSRDHVRRFNVLEPSFSIEGGALRLYRYSYALPDVRRDPAGTAATLLELARPFGDAATAAARRALRAAASPLVEELLFGYADDGGGASRVKLYLQLRADTRGVALELAKALLGRDLRGELRDAGELHLVGLDLGERGLVGAKLYLAHPRVAARELLARVGPIPLVEALADAGADTLGDVLVIHRLEGPDDDRVREPVELDFGLVASDLLWSEVRALAPVAELLARHPAVARLEASFRLDVRRVSVAFGARDKVNVYYALAEPAGAASLGGPS